MKPKRKNINKFRMYEITGVEVGHIWSDGSQGCDSLLLGAIVTVDTPERNFINLTVCKSGPKHKMARAFVELEGLTLRPLSIKDQKKIEEQNRGS